MESVLPLPQRENGQEFLDPGCGALVRGGVGSGGTVGYTGTPVASYDFEVGVCGFAKGWQLMPEILEGDLVGGEGQFAVVVSRYNESITGRLLEGALQTLAAAGVAADAIRVAWVPGAWEIPLIADRFVRSENYSGVICLGAVIRGETTHDQYINRQVTDSLGRLALEAGVPVGFGLLTCDSLEQAIQRAGGAVGNKGVECAEAVLRMADLIRRLPSRAR